MRARVQTNPIFHNAIPKQAGREDVLPKSVRVPSNLAVSGSIRGNSWLQYFVAMLAVSGISLLNICLTNLIGYEAIALVYLLGIVVLALFVNRGPVIFGAALTAASWAFLSAPPQFSLHIASFYDKMMVATYFVVAIIIGQLMSRLRAQKEAELKARLIVESERLSRTLLNSVSHEFRTPIAAITTAMAELRNTASLSPSQERLASEIEAASARLNRVVKSLLNAARVQAGQVQPKIDWCDVSDLIRVTLSDVKRQLTDHRVQTHLGVDLPLVKMDFVLMQQALANLLVNAAIHTPPGTCIEISARVEQKQLRLEVTDSGPGLPEDQLERVFDLFHRIPNVKPGGTGLGLAIVKGFVEAQEGRVKAANRPGGGAIFSIFLPILDAPKLPEEAL